jgi:hypothetical protein
MKYSGNFVSGNKRKKWNAEKMKKELSSENVTIRDNAMNQRERDICL